MRNEIFSSFDIDKVTKITPLETFCLSFIKSRYSVDQIENNIIEYKIFRNKMYIINIL